MVDETPIADRSYLDHASTSPLRPVARDAIVQWYERTDVGDPGRIHREALVARTALEDARSRIAELLGARPREVVVTSGVTEAVAMLSWGTALARGPGTACAPVEHSVVREWAARGRVVELAVDRDARIEPDSVSRAFDAASQDKPDLVHCQWANHEVGTVQPLAEVVEAVDGRALIHVDAAVAAGRVAIDFGSIGADFLSLSGHKFGAPAGTGVLLVRRGVRVPPLLVGGDQERGRRAGMENVAGVIGFAAALEDADSHRTAETARAHALTGRVRDWASTAGVQVYGDATRSIGHIVCLGIDGVEPQPLLIGLDRLGVAVHSGSSCSSEALEPSPVLAAMGVDAQRSLRVSVGWSSTTGDIDRLLRGLDSVLAELRSLRRS